jgi:hypothetical protein
MDSMDELVPPTTTRGDTTYVEWRVTAIDTVDKDYDFVWSRLRQPNTLDDDAAEASARRFIATVSESGNLQNIRLSRRTVTITPWTEVKDG